MGRPTFAITEQVITRIEKAKELIAAFLGMKIEDGDRYEEQSFSGVFCRIAYGSTPDLVHPHVGR
jgi:hypothetical protein